MELDEVFDAFDKNTGDGRDYEQTVALADAYVTENPDEFTKLEDLSLEQCVRSLEVFRDAGFEDEWRKVQVWLWHKFDPQNIGGTYNATVRLQNNG